MSKSKQHEDELVPVDENGEIRCPKCNAEMEGHGVIGHDRHNRECEADWMECPLCGHVMGMELTGPDRDKSDSAMLDWLLNRSSKRKGPVCWYRDGAGNEWLIRSRDDIAKRMAEE